MDHRCHAVPRRNAAAECLRGKQITTFHIELTSQRRDDKLHLEKRGAKLMLNGEVVDPSTYEESEHASQWIVGRPKVAEKGWSFTIILPHGSPAPRATRFPSAITVSSDGPVELPPYDGPDEDFEELCAAVAAKLSGRTNNQSTANDEINIPPRLTLAEMPAGVYFSEIVSPFAKLPVFGAVVSNVIATTSQLELEMLRLAVSQHGTKALQTFRTAYAVLERDEQKRRKYIELFAKATGRDRVWETIRWAYRFSKPIFDIRNAFAHQIWGECPSIPDALLLADPTDMLTGQAAHSQLCDHRDSDAEVQILMRIANGTGGSKLSDADSRALFELAWARQNDPARIEAFDMSFANPLNFHAPSAEIWTAKDFRNVALAANLAQGHVVRRLWQISQWLDGQLAEDELEPLPETDPRNQKR